MVKSIMNDNINTYYLFERDITSNHVSYHFCFKKWENFDISETGKISQVNKKVFEIFNNCDLFYILNDPLFHKVLTPENNFIKSPYFHMSVYGGSDDHYRHISENFFIKTKYKCNYFTKLLCDLNYPTKFKCGFRIDEFKEIPHDFKMQAYKVTKLFQNNLKDVIYAFDFSEEGEIINDNINIEILPKYSIDNFFSCKSIIETNFLNIDHKTLNKYDKMFLSYDRTKFHFHIKIKLYKNQKPTVKIYRTYNSENPYI